MIKSFILSFLFLLFFLEVVQGQNLEKISKNQIEIDIGYQSNYLKDINFSPLNQSGGGLATAVKYQRITKNIFGVKIQFSPGNIKSGSNNEFTTSFIHANFELEYLFKLSPEDKAFHFFLGPVYNTRVFYLDWYDLDAFSFVATHGIGIKGLVSRKIKEKHLIKATLSIPVFQFLARPPYNGIDEFIIENQDSPARIIFNGTPSSFNRYIALEFCVDYKYKLTKQIDWFINYTLYSQKVTEPNLFKSFSNTIKTGIAINF